MLNKYFVFRELLNFVADHADVTDADMNNYSGEIDITGTDEDGSTIRIKVLLKEAEQDGN